VDAPIVYCIAYASKHDVGASMMELRHGYGQGRAGHREDAEKLGES
jgi:hypothetical protein